MTSLAVTRPKHKESAFYLRKLARVLADHWGISPRHWDGRNVFEALREYEASSGGVFVFWACVEHYANETSVFPEARTA